jgi:putative sterol carrier protein
MDAMPKQSSTKPAVATENAEPQVLEIIDKLKANPFTERLSRVSGSYLFDVEDVGAWRIAVDHGKLTVEDGGTDADCIIHCNADYFARLASGKQNLVTAMMQGQVEIEGDLALAQKLSGILPSPHGSNPRGES